MTHGGLGRLAFFYEPKDLATAAFHFQKDLDISEAIGDKQGQIQMHSLLGACALEEDDVDTALRYYHDVLSQSTALNLLPVTLETLVGVAGLLAQQGHYQRAAELLAFVQHPPATVDEIKRNEAAPLLAMLRETMSAEQLEAAFEGGKHLDLDTVVVEILTERSDEVDLT